MALPTVQAPITARPWPEQGQWSFDDWLRMPDDGFRYELIDGELFVGPLPSVSHQIAVAGLLTAIHIHAHRDKLGLVFVGPVGVLLPGRSTIVQPDVLFVSQARREIVRDDVIDGAPDLVVEVLSPSNWGYDRGRRQ